MYLDREQERALQGERGEAIQRAMGTIVLRGDRSDAGRLVPVSSVHVPDWYHNRSSDAWEWLGSMDGKVELPVTANPGGPDDDLTLLHKKVLSDLRSDSPYTFSCAPHLAGNHPTGGEVAAWGGRAAVAFANSVLGARSETEDFISAMASAITGLTAERGLLLEENRRPTIEVKVSADAIKDMSVLGHCLSTLVRDRVPVIRGLRPDFDEVKRFAFAINSEGRVPLFYLNGPKAPTGLERIEVSARECQLSASDPDPPDLLIFGCPHLSEQEINRWSRRLAGRRPGRTEAWFYTSKLCLDKCPHAGALLRSRGRVLADHCPIHMVREMTGRAVGCSSPTLASCLAASGVEAVPLPDHEMSRLLAIDD